MVNNTRFLEQVNLPLMQPLVEEAVKENTPLKKQANLVSQYVVSEETVDTKKTISFFFEHFPFEFLVYVRREMPDYFYCLNPSSEFVFFRNSKAIKMVTSERKLLDITRLFFLHSHKIHKTELSTTKNPLLVGNGEYDDFLSRILGISILKKTHIGDPERCHTLVFKKFKWFNAKTSEPFLFGKPKRAIKFLLSKGFNQAKKVAPKQVGLYHNDKAVLHYGLVKSVDDDSNEITMISKFGSGHTYCHKDYLSPDCNNIIFLKPPLDPS